MAGILKVDEISEATQNDGVILNNNVKVRLADNSTQHVISTSGNTTTIDNISLGSNTIPNSSFMFRNKIINGGMHIAQRGTSFGTVNLVGSTFPYNLDRFCTGRANVVHNGHCTISQITGGGQKHQITQASGSALDGSEYFTIRQHIEGFNCFDLAGKQATLSFKVKTNKAGNYGVSFYDGTGSATITPQSITVSTADASAENKVSYTKTFTMPSSITADNASRLRLDICLAAHNRAGEYYPTGGTQVDLFDSTANYFELYDVQLEEGTVATPFEHRPIGMELSLCQRYCVVWGTAITHLGTGSAYNSTAMNITVPIPVPMRATPTPSKTTTGGNWLNVYVGASGQNSNPTPEVGEAGVNAYRIYTPSAGTGWTAGQASWCQVLSGSSFTLSAEL